MKHKSKARFEVSDERDNCELICQDSLFFALSFICFWLFRSEFRVPFVLLFEILDLSEVVSADLDVGFAIRFVRCDHQIEAGLRGGDVWTGVHPVGLSGPAERTVVAVGVVNDGRGVLLGVQVSISTLNLQVDIDVTTRGKARNQECSLITFLGTRNAFGWNKRKFAHKSLAVL